MKKRIAFILFCFILTNIGASSIISLKKVINEKEIKIEKVSKNNEPSKTEGQRKKVEREYASPLALIIVLVIIVLLFALPPLFLKARAKKIKDEKI